MNKTLKIILITLLILFILLIIIGGVWGYITYKQLKGMTSVYDEGSMQSIQSDIQQVTTGNCSALPSLELKLNDIENKLTEICSNPIAREIVKKKAGRDICLELNSDSQTRKNLETLKNNCTNN